jgi:hypothetical protein
MRLHDLDVPVKDNFRSAGTMFKKSAEVQKALLPQSDCGNFTPRQRGGYRKKPAAEPARRTGRVPSALPRRRRAQGGETGLRQEARVKKAAAKKTLAKKTTGTQKAGGQKGRRGA